MCGFSTPIMQLGDTAGRPTISLDSDAIFLEAASDPTSEELSHKEKVPR